MLKIVNRQAFYRYFSCTYETPMPTYNNKFSRTGTASATRTHARPRAHFC